MKLLIVVLCLVTVTMAAPPPENRYKVTQAEWQAAQKIVHYENENDGSGNYRFAFETSDGTKHEQQGELRNKGREDQYIAVKGKFTWAPTSTTTITYSYTADKDGYKITNIQMTGILSASAGVVASLLG